MHPKKLNDKKTGVNQMLQNIYDRTVKNVERASGLKFQEPELRQGKVGNGNFFEAEYKNYGIVYDPGVEIPSKQKTARLLRNTLESFIQYDKLLEEEKKRQKKKIENDYQRYLESRKIKELNVGHIQFNSLEEDYDGMYYAHNKPSIEIDSSYLGHIVKDETSSVDQVSSALKALIRHEVTHGIHCAINSPSWRRSSSPDPKDIERAPREALTKFEQHLEKHGYISWMRKKMKNPWRIPEIMEELDVTGNQNSKLSENPYKLGLFASESLKAYFEEEYDSDTAENKTRHVLLMSTSTVDSLKEYTSKSYRRRELPYYPHIAIHYYEEFKAVPKEKRDQKASNYFKLISRQIEKTWDQELLKHYYNGHAALTAYRQLEEEPYPREYKNLRDTIRGMHRANSTKGQRQGSTPKNLPTLLS